MEQFKHDAQFIPELRKFMYQWEAYQENHAVGIGSEEVIDELSVDELAFVAAYYLALFTEEHRGSEEERKSHLCDMVVDIADYLFRPYADNEAEAEQG